MTDLVSFISEMAWPVTLLIAWLAGELGHRHSNLPRISAYAVVGFFLAPAQLGLSAQSQPATVLLLANIAFGLILFECGYRINLRWLRVNPWIAATSLLEASATFVAIYLLAEWYGQETSTALLLGALSMATSPATVVRIINEQSSSGQVTERILHLSALNCVLAVFTFKVIVGLVVFRTSGSLWSATYTSLVVLLVSVIAGGVAGMLTPALLRFTKRTTYDSTLAFAITVICLVALTHSLKLSPVLAALTFGLVARHRRIMLNSSQRGFGVLGDLLSVLLFVYIAGTLEWRQVVTGLGAGLALIALRQLAKMFGVALLARASGISWRKSLLVGLAMAPMSAFVILMMEQTRYLGIDLVDQLAPLAAAALTLEILGPLIVQRALNWAGETTDAKET